MSHKHGRIPKPIYRTREASPSMQKTPEGMQIICPFCRPTHALVPGQPASCGTILKLIAVQDILPTRLVRMSDIKCLKCHLGGGEMVQYMNGFVHLNECMPGTKLLHQIPNFSLAARVVYGLPAPIRKWIEWTFAPGPAQQVREIDQAGEETGRVLGYFFMKRLNTQEVPNG